MKYHTKAYYVAIADELTNHINSYVENQPFDVEISIISINYIARDDDGVMKFFVTYGRKGK